MEEITKNNVYAYLLDYKENNLDKQGQLQLKKFLEENPQYKKELEKYDEKITLKETPLSSNDKQYVYPTYLEMKNKYENLLKRNKIKNLCIAVTSIAAVALLCIVMITPKDDALHNTPPEKMIAERTNQDTFYIRDTIYLNDTVMLRDTVNINPFITFEDKFTRYYQTADMIIKDKNKDNNFFYTISFSNKDSSYIGKTRLIYKEDTNNVLQTISKGSEDKEIIGRTDVFLRKYSEPTLEQLEVLEKQIHAQIQKIKSEKNNQKK